MQHTYPAIVNLNKEKIVKRSMSLELSFKQYQGPAFEYRDRKICFKI